MTDWKIKKNDDTIENSGYQTQSKIQTSPISDIDKTAGKTKLTKIPKPQFTSTPKNPRYNLRSSDSTIQENDENFDEISPVVEKVNKDKTKISKIPKTPNTTETNLRTSQRLLKKKLEENANQDFQWFNHVYQKWENMYDWSPTGQYYYYH